LPALGCSLVCGRTARCPESQTADAAKKDIFTRVFAIRSTRKHEDEAAEHSTTHPAAERSSVSGADSAVLIKTCNISETEQDRTKVTIDE